MISEAVTVYPINDYVSRLRFKQSVRKIYPPISKRIFPYSSHLAFWKRIRNVVIHSTESEIPPQ